ncbi:2-dehydro-3-deoxyphosphooctonate aldolase [uncultured Desulfobacterium sp.]|uniref:2-dehydro-3-deoxyphosphooctonate aldolase n=1 Tax=uncultured Desulfobacterium sp. TaxID=201089 RepID=A0A445MT92_9BACT|nr:2-dehydro-3-deoxyphosphooctonate aldolase [uncultured Desulfobacterium sp.]
MNDVIKIGGIKIRSNGPFFLIAGPCVVENQVKTLEIARFLKDLSQDLEIGIIFKASYDKANRTSLNSFRGPGLDEGLRILKTIKDETGLPIVSDVHQTTEVEKAATVLDLIQIPALLCRQTDLLLAAARTGLPINLKKGQFLSPWDIEHAIEKITSLNNNSILLTERGTFFGYNNLVVDIRSIAIMKGFGFPVVFDATHSVQLPGGKGTSSGGQREFVGHLSRAAVAAGADGVFMEVHPDPDTALCDGPNSIPLQELRPMLAQMKKIHHLVTG